MGKRQLVKNKGNKKNHKMDKKANRRKEKLKIKICKRASPKNRIAIKENILDNKINQFPNLKFKSNIRKCKSNEFLFYYLIDVFAVFTLHKNKKIYMALNSNNEIDIDIIDLLNNKKIKTLKSHERCLIILEYYFNPKNKNKEYLISIDRVSCLNIWDINDNYNLIHKIYEGDDHCIVTCLLYFPISSKEDYIITPMHICIEEGSKIYSLKTGQLIKYIYTEYNYIFTILPWHNKNDKKDYIIQISEEKIFINNIIEDNIYSELIDKESDYDINYNGFIYNKKEKDYLFVSKHTGNIDIWDLYEKKLIKKFKAGKDYIRIMKWNENYAIGIKNGIKIIDLSKKKVVKEIKNEINHAQIMNHPEYGLSLIGMDNKNISLWVA